MKASRSYLALANTVPIRPLRSEEELDAAIAMVDSLLSRAKPLDDQEEDYLDCLGHEIERYEDIAHPLPSVSGPAMLRHLMEARSISLSELAEATELPTSTISGILKGRRQLTAKQIKSLADFFGVEPGVFIDG